MPARPRLLFLCHTLPYPPDGGAWIRSFHTLRLLSRRYDVTALCFERLGPRGVDRGLLARGVSELRQFASVEVFDIPQRHGIGRLAVDHARSILLRQPYTRFLFDSKAMRQRLKALLDGTRYSIAHVDSLADLHGVLPALADVQTVAVHHNVESALLHRRAEVEALGPRRWYMRWQADRLAEVERRYCPMVALNVTVSDSDGRRLDSMVPGIRWRSIPNGVDTQEFQPSGGTSRGAVFVGGLDWFPNADALRFFADDVLPRIRKRLPAYGPVRWVGSASSEIRASMARDRGIELTGYVDDTRPYVHGANVFVVPLRAGGGTRLKILNAWAMGKAVVSTSVGCEGLLAEHGVNILVADTPDDFAEAVVELERSPDLRSALGAAARQTAVDSYSWDVIGAQMIELYQSLERQ